MHHSCALLRIIQSFSFSVGGRLFFFPPLLPPIGRERGKKKINSRLRTKLKFETSKAECQTHSLIGYLLVDSTPHLPTANAANRLLSTCTVLYNDLSNFGTNIMKK